MDSSKDSEASSNDPDAYKDVDPDDLDTEDPEKIIQKLSGKLSYELREFDDEEKYSDTAKFALSMIASALDADKISDEDRNAIEKKIDAKLDAPTEPDVEDSGDDIDIDMEESVFFEEDEDDQILFDTDDEFNPYDVDKDKILFDLDEDMVYSKKPKKIKNKKYTQDYFGMDVGRVVGDDDAEAYILELDDESTSAPKDFDFGKIYVDKSKKPRNPFKYTK